MGEQRHTDGNDVSGTRAEILERRRSPRIELLGRVNGHLVTLKRDIVVREMSQGGMSIETPFAFPVGAVHEFRLTLTDGFSADLAARVIHSRPEPAPGDPGRCVTGLMFLDDATSTRALVGELLRRISQSIG
jgi:hypothetical protein